MGSDITFEQTLASASWFKIYFLIVYLFRVNIFQSVKYDIPKVTLIPYVTFIKILGKFPMSRLIGPHAYSALERSCVFFVRTTYVVRTRYVPLNK